MQALSLTINALEREQEAQEILDYYYTTLGFQITTRDKQFHSAAALIVASPHPPYSVDYEQDINSLTLSLYSKNQSSPQPLHQSRGFQRSFVWHYKD